MSRRKSVPTLDPRRAVAYLRVSTEDQNLGPEAQRAAIATWAKREGVELVAEHVDHGVSGAIAAEDRPGLAAAIDDLAQRNAGVLVAAKRDRLARDVVVVGMLERLVQRQGARVVTADGVGEGDGPEAQLMRTMVDAFAAYERALIRMRTRAALRAKRAKGERAGNLPFGYEVDPSSTSLSRKSGLPQGMRMCPREQRALAAMRRLAAAGEGSAAIARELNRRGLRNRGKGWTQAAIWKLLHSRPGGGA